MAVGGGHFVQILLRSRMDLKLPETPSKVIESEFRTSKMADRSEMARNAIKSDFRTSKMAAEKKKFVSI